LLYLLIEVKKMSKVRWEM